MLPHEKLHVYAKALDFAGVATAWVIVWDKKHSLVDQLSRATESILLNLGEAARQLSHRIFRQIDQAGTSIVLNIAEGNGRFAELDHHRFWQIAQTAAVKAAVYLDLAVERTLLTKAEVATGKGFLRRISAMATGS